MKSCTPTNMTGKITIPVWDWYWKCAAPPAAGWRELLPLALRRLSKEGKDWKQEGEGFFFKGHHISLVKAQYHSKNREKAATYKSPGLAVTETDTAQLVFDLLKVKEQYHSVLSFEPELHDSSCCLLKTNELVSDLSREQVPPEGDFCKSFSTIKFYTLR